MTRSSVILTGLAGVVAAVFLTAFCLYIMVAGYISVILVRPFFVWGLFFFLLFFSLAEIPVMTIGMRSMATNPNPKARTIALMTNAGFTFFAGVYAAPFILLAGHSTLNLVAGALLGALCFARFVSSLLLLPNDAEQS